MSPSSNVTIVVVDDDPGHTELVKRNLRRTGISNDIVAINNGTAALDYVFAHSATEGDLDWQYEGPTPDAGRFALTVHSRLRPDGAGRADAQGTVEALPGLQWRLTQCWDATFLERYADSNIVRPVPDGGVTTVVPGYLCLDLEGQPCPAGPVAACAF